MRKLPYILLIGFVFTIPWSGIFILEGMGTLNRLIGLLLVGMAILYIFLKKHVKEPPVLVWSLTIYLAFVLFSYIWSINGPSTISRFVTGIQLLAMVWLIWQLCNTENEKILLLISFIAGQYVAILYMLFLFFTDQFTSYRVSLENFDPNNLATTLALGVPISVFLLNKSKYLAVQTLMLLYTPLAFYCVILTASRGGLIIILIGMIAFPLYFRLFDTRRRVLVSLGIIFIMMFIILNRDSLISNLERNIERLSSTAEMMQEGRLSGRERIWKAGFEVYKENPIIGVGAGGFRHAVEQHLYRQWAPHNAYISILVDVGIIGFILFVLSFIVTFSPIMNYSIDIKILNTMLLAMLLIGMVNLGWEFHRITWLILAILTLFGGYVYRDGKLIFLNE
jgi:O-antigen ligase